METEEVTRILQNLLGQGVRAGTDGSREGVNQIRVKTGGTSASEARNGSITHFNIPPGPMRQKGCPKLAGLADHEMR